MSQQNPRSGDPGPNSLAPQGWRPLRRIDPSAIAKAEAALKNLSGNFAQWLQDEVVKLDAARQRGEGPGPQPPRPSNASICAPTT